MLKRPENKVRFLLNLSAHNTLPPEIPFSYSFEPITTPGRQVKLKLQMLMLLALEVSALMTMRLSNTAMPTHTFANL